MCKFLSGLYFKNGDVFDAAEYTQSHEAMIRAHGIVDARSGFSEPACARWEFTPPDNLHTIEDLSTWTLEIDEWSIPEWWDAGKVRSHCERRVSAMMIREPRGTVIGGMWILTGDGASIRELVRGSIAIVANGSTLAGANMAGANMARSTLTGANMADATLTGANLYGADLTRSNLTRSTLAGANMDGANLTGANLAGANLTRSNLTGSTLAGANMARSTLTGANMAGANMARSTLTGANMAGANMARSNLTGANMAGANMDGANLTGANMAGANMDGANLTGAIGVNLPSGWKLTESLIVVKA